MEIERGKQGEGSRVWLYMTQYDNGNSNNHKVSLKTPLTMGGGQEVQLSMSWGGRTSGQQWADFKGVLPNGEGNMKNGTEF